MSLPKTLAKGITTTSSVMFLPTTMTLPYIKLNFNNLSHTEVILTGELDITS